MHEMQPDHVPQEKLVDKELEVAELVALNQYIWGRIEVERAAGGMGHGADVGLDILGNYCEALAQRDPEIGGMLISALETQSESNPDPDYELTDRLRAVLGLPGIDEAFGNDPQR